MTIIAAAIKFGDLVVHISAPARHHTILHRMNEMGAITDEMVENKVQGFIDHTGYFHSRYSAMGHALACGTVLRRTPGVGYHGPELFSEDLW